tara:strand:- start:3729 stop:4601 length:873 start_codon:yes stop_codon:yes gene_type:complete
MKLDGRNIESALGKLRRPLKDSEVEWRVGRSINDTTVTALCYINARTVDDRLDDAVGPENWQNSFIETDKKNIATISVKVNGEWISKSDGAGDTKVEGSKGGLSDAHKRAAVKWGIGRHLYDLGDTKVELKPGYNPPNMGTIEPGRIIRKKSGSSWYCGVAPSLQENLQFHLYSYEELVSHIQPDLNRRAARIRVVLKREKVEKSEAAVVIEAASAVWEKGEVKKNGMSILDVKTNNEVVKITSNRMVKWSEAGVFWDMVEKYSKWVIDTGRGVKPTLSDGGGSDGQNKP